MNLQIEIEREDDGRWIAEVEDLAGVLVYGETRDEALQKVKTLALQITPIVWKTAKVFRSRLKACFLKQYEQLEVFKSETSFEGIGKIGWRIKR